MFNTHDKYKKIDNLNKSYAPETCYICGSFIPLEQRTTSRRDSDNLCIECKKLDKATKI